ncbi:MAG TPA: imidazoleglycerol-phosphate dehydratase, partial [Thermoanaerobaculia bacterium]
MSRSATVKRVTKETNVEVGVVVDGSGASSITTPVGFLSHMLDALAKHSGMDLTVLAEGDVEIDNHHTVEDVGLA